MDVGGTSAKIGLVGLAGDRGEVLARESVPTGYDASRATLMAAFQAAVARLISAGTRPEAIGVGMPGLQDEEGRVQDASNLPSLNGVAVARELGAAFSLPARMDNDLNVAGLGEWRFGGHPKTGRRLLAVYLGTGIGAAMVASGQVLRPTHGSLGDPGHILVNPQGRRCRCGATGCLETEVSGWSLENRPGINDPASRDEIARWLGMGLASFCVLYEPDVIVLGGQNALRGGEPFRQATESHMRRLAQSRFGSVPVRLSQLGDTAGILGGAAMMLGPAG
jgi:glucokinase